MDDPLQRILVSENPSDPIREAVWEGPVLRRLNQHIFSSLFSSYVEDHPAHWTAQAAEVALQLLSEEGSGRYCRDWLLEIAFHGNLALSNTEGFYRNINRIEAALQHLEHEGLSRSSQYVKGLLAYARDDLVAAERAFITLPDMADTRLLAHQAGYAAFRAPGFFRTLTNYKPEVRLNFTKESGRPGDASVVLLCAVDDLYLAAFGEEFAAHVLGVSATAHVHFHLINSTVEPSRLTQTDILSDERVSLTAERTDLSEPGKYAIMARYIILPLLMQKWERPVLVTDVDLTVRSDPASLDVNESVTLGFSKNTAAVHIPASAIIGHHNLFQPSESGLAFARLLSRYLHYMCENGRALWAADQVALLMVSRMLGNVMSIGSFRDVRSYRYGSPADRPLKKKEAAERLAQIHKHHCTWRPL